MKRSRGILTGLTLASAAAALDLNIQDVTSIKQTAGEIAKGLYVYHNPDSLAGDFNQPKSWFWWLSGNAWNGLLDYTVYTNDTTYQSDLLTALGENVGADFDFNPAAQFNWIANDDQMYWVYNALTAMEYSLEPLPCAVFPNGSGCANSWLGIGTNAFELFVSRWNADGATCGGGLKWQWNTAVNGFFYKNAVTNGGFFQTAARLARYTGNQTFADWADKIWDWSTDVGIISADFHVFDGTWDDSGRNCSEVSADQWSYNIATYMHGAAHMYAFTNGSEIWEERVQSLVAAANSTFFSPLPNATGVMYEQKCELSASCGTDQTSFKSSLARWMGKTAVLVPIVKDDILALLQASASGAASACSGYGNSTCGMKWYADFEGQSDFGTALSALDIVQSLLVTIAPPLEVLAPSF